MEDPKPKCGFKCDVEVHPDCTVHNESRLDRVSESMTHDPERWVEGYTVRNTESVRRGVLAASNGHSSLNQGFAVGD